ncbi:MAG: hypothetical protein UHN02_01700 [Acutalibacteraceae bacterium]|nr:hypothetical protein [Acutalibacteraceae bacterium]
MKATICKIDYDTDTAVIIEKFTYGNFGDEDGYEETLYVTEQGNYFVYTNGGAKSPYPTESIKRLAKTKVDAWIEQHK